MKREQIIEHIGNRISEGESLKVKSKHIPSKDNWITGNKIAATTEYPLESPDDFVMWKSRCINLLHAIFSDDSPRADIIDKVKSLPVGPFEKKWLVGELKGIKEDIVDNVIKLREESNTVEVEISLVESICSRVRESARVLTSRRSGKAPYVIEDEYDVQDLIMALVKSQLAHAIQENSLGKKAGTKSSRSDIFIKELGTIIEIKYSREKNQKRITQQLSEDLVLYSAWPELRSLFFVIYNSDVLKDPEALRELEGRTEISEVKFKVKVFLA